jgi:hypothetical protein
LQSKRELRIFVDTTLSSRPSSRHARTLGVLTGDPGDTGEAAADAELAIGKIGVAGHVLEQAALLDFFARIPRALRQMIDAAGGSRRLKASGVAQIARMAVITSKKWAPGSTVRARFLDGSAKMKKTVTAIAKEWQKHADIKIKFVTSGDAEVRISFYADSGSWSAVPRGRASRACSERSPASGRWVRAPSGCQRARGSWRCRSGRIFRSARSARA